MTMRLTIPSFAIGIVGDAGVRGTAQQPRLFVGMILILIFAEVLGKHTLRQSWSARRLLTRYVSSRSLRTDRRLVDELECFGDMFLTWHTDITLPFR